MTSKEILSMSFDDFNKLSEKELRKATKILVDVANKRLKALNEKGIQSSAARGYASRTGGKFSTSGKSLNQLKAEFTRTKNFLQARTSKLTGAKEAEKRMQKSLEARGVQLTDKKNVGRIFSLYDKLRERNPEIAEQGMKYTVIRQIQQEQNDNPHLTDEQILKKTENELEALYQNLMDTENDIFGSVSEFFE